MCPRVSQRVPIGPRGQLGILGNAAMFMGRLGRGSSIHKNTTEGMPQIHNVHFPVPNRLALEALGWVFMWFLRNCKNHNLCIESAKEQTIPLHDCTKSTFLLPSWGHRVCINCQCRWSSGGRVTWATPSFLAFDFLRHAVEVFEVG